MIDEEQTTTQSDDKEQVHIRLNKTLKEQLQKHCHPGQNLAGLIEELITEHESPPDLKRQQELDTRITQHNESVKAFAEQIAKDRAGIAQIRQEADKYAATVRLEGDKYLADVRAKAEEEASKSAQETVNKAKAEAQTILDLANAEVPDISRSKEVMALRILQENIKKLDQEITTKTARLHKLEENYVKTFNQMVEYGEQQLSWHQHKATANWWTQFLNSLTGR